MIKIKNTGLESQLEKTSLLIEFGIEDVEDTWFMLNSDICDNEEAYKRTKSSTFSILEGAHFSLTGYHPIPPIFHDAVEWRIQDGLTGKKLGKIDSLREFYNGLTCQKSKRLMMIKLRDFIL
jgi:hypothetical protein